MPIADYAACRDPNSSLELRRLADASGQKVRVLALHVTDPTSIKSAAAELDGQAIDLLLNNAGIIGPQRQTIGNIDYEAWAKVFDANTMGPMRVPEAFVDHVARSKAQAYVTHGIDCRQYFWRLLAARSPIAAQRPQ